MKVVEREEIEKEIDRLRKELYDLLVNQYEISKTHFSKIFDLDFRFFHYYVKKAPVRGKAKEFFEELLRNAEKPLMDEILGKVIAEEIRKRLRRINELYTSLGVGAKAPSLTLF